MPSSSPAPCSHTLALAGLLLCSLSCTSGRGMLSEDDGSSADDSVGTTSTTETTAPPTVSTTIPEPPDDTTDPGSDATGVLFLLEPDGGGESFECDIFEQDCPPGHKCMPWANDGGSAWNATRCTPIADDPAGPDEPCTVEGSGTSGIDDCELGSMCWDVDPRTNEGHCVPFCVGSDHGPYCEDPGRYCAIGSDGAIVLCLPMCDPIGQDCPSGQACYPIQGDWKCASDGSGDQGAYGDKCEYINACDPGLVCLNAATVPPGQACEGATGCCTEVCDISDPLGDAQCAGVAGGQTCQAWYEPGTAPVGYDDVGVCALPA